MTIDHITIGKFIHCVNIVKIYLSSKVKSLNHIQVFRNRIPTWFIYILSVSVNISLLNLVYTRIKRDIIHERQPRMKKGNCTTNCGHHSRLHIKAHILYICCVL